MLELPQADTVFISLLGGILPAVLWLWFWQKQDSARPEPRGLVILLFTAGMLSVVFVIPLQKLIYGYFDNQIKLLTAWAAVEEIAKFLAFWLVAARSRFLDEPVDYAVNMITVALGFAAFENTLFLLDPIENEGAVAGLLTGNMRFIGATVLHTVTSAFIGIGMGLAVQSKPFVQKLALLFGLLTAVTLHTLFNFFIIAYKEESVFTVFAFLWVIVVIVMLLFEKLKALSREYAYIKQ